MLHCCSKKDIAWLVSHCNTPSKREDYVTEMKKCKGLQIDVLGKCGGRIQNSKIPNRSIGWEAAYQILAQQYKFYLSFENSRCYEYITEKLYTAMKASIVS